VSRKPQMAASSRIFLIRKASGNSKKWPARRSTTGAGLAQCVRELLCPLQTDGRQLAVVRTTMFPPHGSRPKKRASPETES
jgi:hypothetical protein